MSVSHVIMLFRVVCLLLLMPGYLAASPVCTEDVVNYVPDGDTVFLDSGISVRLQGIDAPEIGRNGERSGYFARESAQYLNDLLVRQRITVCSDADSTGTLLHDRYGRLLGTVLLADGRTVNDMLVADGMATVYYHADVPQTMLMRLMALQRRAADGGRGLWGGLSLQGRFIGNRRSRRLFIAGCDGEERISTRNRVVFSSLRQALLEGYAPARHCNIWPLQ